LSNSGRARLYYQEISVRIPLQTDHTIKCIRVMRERVMRKFEQIIQYVNGELTTGQVDELWAGILESPELLRILEMVAFSRELTEQR
jgi:hypothetical protein